LSFLAEDELADAMDCQQGLLLFRLRRNNLTVGCVTASQIAPASMASAFVRFT
jgi:hypothetical protein